MKGIILLAISFAITICCFSQGSTERYAAPLHVPTNIERYKVDYELVNGSLFDQDNSIVAGINLNMIDYLRQPFDDVVYFDKRSGLEILIYSEQRATAGKTTSIGLKNPSKH